jgi:hypothetical protein
MTLHQEDRPLRIRMVCGFDEDDACVRLQSGAVVRGLADTPGVDCRFYKPDAPGFADQPIDALAFHYNDGEAVAFVRAHRHLAPQAAVLCFGADIYSYRRYTRLCDIVDCFVMPTALHRSVLSAQMEVPVHRLDEPVDPLALGGELQAEFPLKHTRHLGWFGYPESFYKGMLSLMPVVQRHLAAGTLDSFTLLTDPARFPNDWSLPLKRYSRAGFRDDLRAFDYVLLSHFPLDLHINSLVKSPNKAITALVAGAIPIASDTPAYRELLGELGLTQLLVESPRQLDDFLGRLDPQADSAAIRASGALHRLRSSRTDALVGKRFLDLLQEHGAGRTDRVPAARRDIPLTLEQFNAERVLLKNRVSRALRSRMGGRP